MIADHERLPRRDWIILPLLGLLSLALLLGVSEGAARLIWPEQLYDRCALPDPNLRLRFKPGCVARVKAPESPWLEYAYNDCGLRTAEPCRPKPPGDFRVAVIGSSISSGYMVPYEKTFPARATAALEQRCHIPVDFQNLAVAGAGLETAPLHLDQALALHPDTLLMALSAHDLEVLRDVRGAPQEAEEEEPAAQGGLHEALHRLVLALRTSRASLMAQHFLYEHLDTYLPLYLKHGDEADFLRPPFSEAWKLRLAIFDRELDEITARTQAAGVPFMLVFVPQRAQAMLLRWKNLPPGIDPTLLGRALGDLARRHGVAYVDLTATIGERADAPSLYYPVDSHPNAAASAIIADGVVDGLLREDAALATCRDQAQAGK